jgi:hypothetical protein
MRHRLALLASPRSTRGSGSEASAAYWITRDIVYTVDHARGIDIVRFKGAR